MKKQAGHKLSVIQVTISLFKPLFIGDPDSRPKEHTLFTRYKIWYNWLSNKNKCHGRWLREVCNVGNGDLKAAVTSPGLFLNKIQLSEEPVAYRCLEEWYRNEINIEHKFKSDYYKDIISKYPR